MTMCWGTRVGERNHDVGHPFVVARDGQVYCLPCYARKWGRPVIDVAPLTSCQQPGRMGA